MEGRVPAGRFEGSVVSYPQRGSYGSAAYRGNTTGLIVEQFLHTFHGDREALFFDPCEGSGTSGDVAEALGIRYRGFDLRFGFDSTHEDLRGELGEEAGSAFVHPPYAGMVLYSSSVWGREADPDDLSQSGKDVDEFLERLQAMLQNVYRAIRPGGHYGLLLGNWRNAGKLIPLPALSTRIAPGQLVAEIIKVQHGVTSDRSFYSGSDFVPMRHEVLHVYRREADGSIFAVTADVLQRLERMHSGTWRNLIKGAFRGREAMTLSELYEAFDRHPRTQGRAHWREKIRQVVQTEGEFERLGRGRYRLAQQG